MKPNEAIHEGELPTATSSKPAKPNLEVVNDEATASRGSGVTAVIALIILIVLPAGYVLSIGPLVWLNSRQYINVQSGSFVAMFYAPLEYAHSEWPTVAKPLDWYVELWEANQPPPQWVAPTVPAPNAMPVPAPVTTPGNGGRGPAPPAAVQPADETAPELPSKSIPSGNIQ